MKNDGARIDLGRLRIDNVAPTSILPNEFRSWNWFYGDDTRTIMVSDIDELIDASLSKVINNGEELDFKYSSEENTFEFTLGKGWHNVGIILTDSAGNSNNIQERENMHIGFFWLWLIGSASVVLAAATSVAMVYYVAKKRRLESE